MPNPIVVKSRTLNPSSDYAHTHTRTHRVKVQTLPDGAGYEASIQTPQKLFVRQHAQADRAAMFVQQDVRNAEFAGEVYPVK